MRIVLEWLGILEPDPARREPVAVPGWAPMAVASSGALLAGILALAAWTLLRALVL